MSKRLKMALCAALVPIAMAAHATNSSVVFDKFRFSVVDLDPNDGIDASFQFLTGPGTYYESNAWSCIQVVYGDERCEGRGGGRTYGLFSPFATSSAITGAEAHGEVGSTNLSPANGGWLAAMASASRPGVTVSGRASVAAMIASSWPNLWLGPHSRLVVSADYSILLQAYNPWGDRISWEVASGGALLNGSVNHGSNQQVQFGDALFADPDAVPVSRSDTGTLTIMLDNLLSTTELASMHAEIEARAESLSGPPVPEPSTAMLCAAGLLAVGGATLRKRRRSAVGIPT